jgi:hypothetical protein
LILTYPEMQFGKIVFSEFCSRATFHTAWVERVKGWDVFPKVSNNGHAVGTWLTQDHPIIAPSSASFGDKGFGSAPAKEPSAMAHYQAYLVGQDSHFIKVVDLD